MRQLINGVIVALVTWCGSSYAVNCCNVVVEYHNTVLDHYFLAFLPVEISAIDSGKAGPGRVRTGETFVTEDYGLWSIGPQVFRFYGSPEIGPNSHFYTNDLAEYYMLRQIEADTPPGVRKWHYETYAFPAGSVGPTGCAVPQVYFVPVYRLYNNGVARGIDPNHRYAKRPEVIADMVAKGWILEGPVFCVIQ
jgi:serine protease